MRDQDDDRPDRRVERLEPVAEERQGEDARGRAPAIAPTSPPSWGKKPDAQAGDEADDDDRDGREVIGFKPAVAPTAGSIGSSIGRRRAARR